MRGTQPLHVLAEPPIEAVHSTRSASTVAGMSGVCSSGARTRGSNIVNDVGAGARSYLGGESEFTALVSAVRETQPLRDACLRHAFRSQSSGQRPVLQSDHTPIVECRLFAAETVQFSSAADRSGRARAGSHLALA